MIRDNKESWGIDLGKEIEQELEREEAEAETKNVRAALRASGLAPNQQDMNFPVGSGEHMIAALAAGGSGTAVGSVTSPSLARAVHDESLPPLFPPGSTICQYQIICELGRGGMSAVYLARDTKLGRRVAIKLLLSNDRRVAERFVAEGRATARCAHENIVVVHEVDEHGGNPFMVLEYIKGQTLRTIINQQKLGSRRALELIVPVVRALTHAHEMGIVHRDLKPENVMITDSGTVKVLDFGIAKLLAGDEFSVSSPELRIPAGDVSMTMTGAFVGTLPYMSPEQMRNEEVDHRTDIWAVGIMLCEMVTGQHPLAPLSRSKLVDTADLSVPMPSMSGLVPGKLGAIIDRSLIKPKARRTGTARELLAELELLLPSRTQDLSLSEDESPFIGLKAFEESDSDRFLGRASDVASMVTRLRNEPLTAIVAPPGTGKTSLVQAGVIPALKRADEGWEAFVIRPGRHPVAALGHLIDQTMGQAGGTRTSVNRIGPLPDYDEQVRRLREEPGYLGTQLRVLAQKNLGRIALFVDQFEELYTLGADHNERAAFIACLEGAADDATSPIRVILVTRSDFLDRVAKDRQFTTEVTSGLMFMPHLSRDCLREALIRPVEAVGYRFENPHLVESMLDALDDAPSALPQLQFAATKMWEMRDSERQLLTQDGYDAIGGVTGALANHADTVLATLTAPERELAKSIFEHLVTPERSGAITSMHNLPGDPTEVEQVIDQLAAAGLLIVEEGRKDQGKTVELIHESLVDSWPTLSSWVESNAQDDTTLAFLARLRTTATVWEQEGRSEDKLWRGEEVWEARYWHKQYQGQLAVRDQQYLDAVFTLADRKTHSKKSIMIGAISVLAVLVLLAVVALVWVGHAEREASREAAIAAEKAAKLAAEARAKEKEKESLRQSLHQQLEARVQAEYESRKARHARAAAERIRKEAEYKLQQARMATIEQQETRRKIERELQAAIEAEKEAEEEIAALAAAKEKKEREEKKKKKLQKHGIKKPKLK
ncbi:MAG: serine/threonine protein kinase [Proteobacteria bacterium]|nr:serine/threonine protein kinase [Pseudomonadota bacterium]